MSLRGALDWIPDLTKWSWCILLPRQCLQCVTTAELNLNTFEGSRLEIAECNTLSLGCPSLWCQSNHLLVLLTLKAKEEAVWADLDGACVKTKFLCCFRQGSCIAWSASLNKVIYYTYAT